MKFLILLCSLSIFGGATYAQNLNVVSTFPADGAFAVDTDSVVLTFDQKFDPDFFVGDSMGAGVFFFLSPEDSVEYTNFSLSDDSLSVIYHVDLAENTDFIGILVQAYSKNGSVLEDPYLFQFTTAPSRGEFVVEGTLPQPVLEKAISEHPFEDIILALSPNPIFFGPSDCDDEECEEEDDIEPLYAAFVDKETGEYSVSGVREGSYYPLGLNFFNDDDFEDEDEFFIPEFYFYDPDDNFVPDSISVNSTTAPTDTLSGIDLRIFELIPVTFSEALEMAQSVIDELDNSPVIVGGSTFYASISTFEDDDDHEGDSTSFKNRLLQNLIERQRPAEVMSANDHQDEEDIFEILTNPSGEQFEWMIFGYDDVKDSAFTIAASPFSVEFLGYISEEDAELPDSVSFSDIAPLPTTYIDSDSAAAIIEANGGWEFRSEFSEDPFSIWTMELQALNNFWEVHEDTLIENLPVMWSGYYHGFTFNPVTGFAEEGYLVVYLDMETGDIIYTDSFIGGLGEESLITFSEALDLAQPFFDEMENSPVIVGGSTFYASVGLFEGGDSLSSPKLKTSVFDNIVASHSTHNDHGGDDGGGLPFNFFSEPNGKQLEWQIYGYDSVKDSAFVLAVSDFEIKFDGYVGPEDAELPDSVGFADIEPLPANIIDSDSAAAIIEANGGWDFRTMFSGEFGFWEAEFEALDNYWELNEDTLLTEAPITWHAEYYGYSFDPFTSSFVEGYFVIYIDIETGDVIYSDTEIVSESFTSHITFNEAIDLADSLIESLPNDVEIMGGLTHYTNIDIAFKGTNKRIPESFKAKVAAAKDEHGPLPAGNIQPDGYAFSWEVYLYDETEDKVIILNVTEFDVSIFGFFTEEDFEDDIEFDDMMPLSFNHIDSDSAAKLFDAEGALNFRTSKEESDLEWYWDSELQLLHQYWDFPPNPTSTAPITWKADYYAWAYDGETNESYEDSLTIYLNAETGEVLFSTVIVSNDEEPVTPDRFSLSQNYPNPFNPSTNIPFELSEASQVEISVYSILGQKVATIVNEMYTAGSHSIQWNAQNLASGVYIYRMQAGGFTQTRKLILLK
ncbi:MAG: T9SS type A sorting domain-containing protein [Balneolaceae bacterium]|nr:T9SS type A sorting domain-containing protein [Balneolaceae bacterium]MBO6547712.1 T9SS type A sorting domain-containing protein [Balneolaceae bacterium]MBO6648223.1 T9SS type A sorting domain-containing protein [Balneolaceae bacterium]